MPPAVLSLDNIHKCYGANEVLKGVSLTAHAGDVISLVGSSGSGKSTLLRCVNLLETPDSGSIHLGPDRVFRAGSGPHQRPSAEALRALRTRVTMVFQQFNLWSHLSVLQNVAEAPLRVKGLSRAEAFELAQDCLDKVGAADKADAYPQALSGGQQQRVAIARALAMRPELILFDEPTSALDPERVGEVLAVMRRLAEEGTTMIVVTHEMAFARDVCNQAVFLHEGRITEAGDPQQIFRQPQTERLQQFLAASLH
ncbi:amino acid ABC transporter ATP-binding protein [Granulosicoccaceae sp. 1_MG-2023]|nr:amino acid ABC transporter ATP-binding protein [Granulosicoccaceae sp. 1_MG-2023]